MTEPITRPQDETTSELARAVRVTPGSESPHPTVEALLRRDRKSGETRRMTEFLRIDRGREA